MISQESLERDSRHALAKASRAWQNHRPIETSKGKPLPGFTLADAPEVYGDFIEQAVPWKGGADVAELAGKVIRLRFVIRDADLFSFQFVQ